MVIFVRAKKLWHFPWQVPEPGLRDDVTALSRQRFKLSVNSPHKGQILWDDVQDHEADCH